MCKIGCTISDIFSIGSQIFFEEEGGDKLAMSLLAG